MTEKNDEQEGRPPRRLLFMAFGTLGVVYGDIGTSPLYALRQCFHGSHAVAPTVANVLGVLSLIFWALVLVISVKYLLLVLRADNQGEGGILALMELVLPGGGRGRAFILALGFFGAALLYGDGAITPAISVLSAVEGLEVATPLLHPYIIPITLVILVLLFMLQSRGTGGIGMVFGPVMLLWFLVIGAVGLAAIAGRPAVLAAVNPLYAGRFFLAARFESLFILGAVFLVVTGGEALYADIGHFGRTPIRISWFAVVLPGLLLNYFGQGALLLHDPGLAINPFYHLTPDWALYPMVALATVATVIASQAIISGIFSLTFQAVQLGYLPRQRIIHTSPEEQGQIYLPEINRIMFAATAAMVLGFRTSANLASAYGVAVTTTMVITTILAFIVMRSRWQWRLSAALVVAGFFLAIDLAFFAANFLKIRDGGWVPLLLAGLVYLMMSTWAEGRQVVARQLRDYLKPLKKFINDIDLRSVKKVPGTAVYLTDSPLTTPTAFVHNVRQNRSLHRRVIFVSLGFKNVPHVGAKDRLKIGKLPKNCYRVMVRYGFMDRPDVQAVMRIIDNRHLKIDPDRTYYFVGRDTLIPTEAIGMSKWRSQLYLFMRRNSTRDILYFNLPQDRVVEIGGQIKI